MAPKVEPDWSWVKKSSVGFLVLATLLFTIAFAAPYWGRSNLNEVKKDSYFGMWRHCTATYGGGQACTDFIDYGNYGDWLKACQSFSTLAFIGLLGTVGIYGAYVLASMDSLPMLACAVASGLLVVIFQVITIGVFAVEYKEYFITQGNAYDENSYQLGWAWYVALVSTIFTFAAPATVIAEYLQNMFGEDDY